MRVLWTHCGLTSADGHLSFSKLVTLLVLAAYWLGAALPVSVALMLIFSAHGTKVVLAAINRRAVTAEVRELAVTTIGGPPPKWSAALQGDES